MSCVGYQSRLFPVCVNSLPHRLCLGLTLPQGAPFKMVLVGNCVSVYVGEPRSSACNAICACHRVVLQCNLLMNAFLVSTFTAPPPSTSLLHIYNHWSGEALLLCGWESPLKFFRISDSDSNEGRGAGNVTEHTP